MIFILIVMTTAIISMSIEVHELQKEKRNH